jgi:hypothetical protein
VDLRGVAVRSIAWLGFFGFDLALKYYHHPAIQALPMLAAHRM